MAVEAKSWVKLLMRSAPSYDAEVAAPEPAARAMAGVLWIGALAAPR